MVSTQLHPNSLLVFYKVPELKIALSRSTYSLICSLDHLSEAFLSPRSYSSNETRETNFPDHICITGDAKVFDFSGACQAVLAMEKLRRKHSPRRRGGHFA